MIPIGAYHRGSMCHSKDQGRQVGALRNNPRISIGLEAIAGGGDLVREITEVGIQVSETLVSN
jgi:hypothetical protein